MKLAPLLAQYLYTHKRLDLPGIGTFLLDPTVIIEREDSKQSKPGNPEGISFETNTAFREAPELIGFISSQTGKMKALASADLESYLELARQFLNIGKPFLFEGIGSIVKIRSGQFAFASGQSMPDKMKEYTAKEISSTSSTEESFTKNESIFYAGQEKINWRKPVAALLLLAGIGLAVWGSYIVYKRTVVKKNVQAPEENKPQEIIGTSVPFTDSTSLINKYPIIATAQNIPSGNYKFILETATAKRAFERYLKLKSYQWPVQMETKDSLAYKLFIRLPASVADTTRIIDSLTAMNGRKVHIEN